MLNLDLPVSVSSPFVWLAAAVVLAAAAALVVRGYRRRGNATDRGRREAPPLLMPSPDPQRPGPLARLLGYGDSTANPRARVAGVIGAAVVIAGVVLLFRGAEPRVPPAPVYVQTALQERPAYPARDTGAREITGSQVAVDSATGERLVLWSGDDQAGVPGRRLRQLLSVVVTDADHQPLAGREVRFEVAQGGGSLDLTSVVTGESGLAVTSWRLGQDPAALTVVASLADRPDVRVRFTASFGTTLGQLSSESTGTDGTRSPAAEPAPDTTASTPDPDATRPGEPAAASGGSAAGARPVRAVTWSVGGVHTCRVSDVGALLCGAAQGPGSEGFGILADPIRSVAAGVFHVCGIRGDATIGCWAAGEGGGSSRDLAGEWALPGGGTPQQLAVGSEHVCARSGTRQVYCWGGNGRGQLGIGSRDGRQDPAPVRGIDGAVQLVSGWFHTCALAASGQAFCWGANDAGQLGLGSPGDRNVPTPVDQPSPFASLTAGSKHTCGLTAGGQAWCWGDNEFGALGTGVVETSDRPRRVNTDLTFVTLAAGGAHTCGLTRSGLAWCWGRNVFGQLGDGTTEDSEIPLPVHGDRVYQRIAGGGAHTCGETVQGDLFCWGNNFQGQLWDGTRENRAVPVAATRPR